MFFLLFSVVLWVMCAIVTLSPILLFAHQWLVVGAVETPLFVSFVVLLIVIYCNNEFLDRVPWFTLRDIVLSMVSLCVACIFHLIYWV